MIKEPNWESEDAVATRVFLESDHGKRFFERLKWMRPDFDSRNDATARLIESGEVEGYERCLENIATLQEESKPQKEDRPSDYPDLNDDSIWNDDFIVQQNATTA